MARDIRFCTTADGVRIAYATEGEGPPLVLVPGWVSHQEISWELPLWEPLIEVWRPHFQIVFYDKRGTGLSDRGVRDFSVEARLRDLEAVVEHLKLRRVALYGYSEGGPVAMAYAAAHPRRVSALVLGGTFGQGPRLTANDQQRQTIDALISLVRAEWGLGSQTLSNIFAAGAPPEAVEQFVQMQRMGATREDAAAMLEANVETDVSALLAKIRTPTLVFHVRGDRAVPFELGRRLASSIKDARFMAVEGDAHILVGSDQRGIAEAVKAFVLEHQGAAKREARAPAGLVTILFTDIESSSSLRQRLGDAQAQELVRVHNDVVREALAAHHGSEIKHTGDGIMASFHSAVRALDCAIAVQRGIAAYREAHPDAPLAVYVGLNAGEPIAEERDLFGTSVDLARRICDAAQPGEILASNVVRELASGKGYLFSEREAVPLKGFEDPVRLYEVRWRE